MLLTSLQGSSCKFQRRSIEVMGSCSIHWGVSCKKKVSRIGTSSYIVITCPCPWCVLLAQRSWILGTGECPPNGAQHPLTTHRILLEICATNILHLLSYLFPWQMFHLYFFIYPYRYIYPRHYLLLVEMCIYSYIFLSLLWQIFYLYFLLYPYCYFIQDILLH